MALVAPSRTDRHRLAVATCVGSSRTPRSRSAPKPGTYVRSCSIAARCTPSSKPSWEAQQRALQSRRKRADLPCVFPLTKNLEFIQQSSVTDKHVQAALTELGIRARRQYNCRHTYATMCLMAGMNPAFIATQLGHSVQMLLSTYARWINSSTDWGELGKLENSLIGTKLVQTETVPL